MRALCLLLVASVAAAGPAKPPHGIASVTISVRSSGEMSRVDRTYALTWDGVDAYVSSDRKQATSEANVVALANALTDLKPTDRDLTCMNLAGVSPKIAIAGAHPARLSSTSTCTAHIRRDRRPALLSGHRRDRCGVSRGDASHRRRAWTRS